MNEFDKEFYNIVGKKLRELRINSNLTLKDVASHVDLTEKTIQRYETGERKINAQILKSIIEFIGGNYNSFTKEVQIEQLGYSSESKYEVSPVDQIDGVYLSLAKDAQDNGIDPEDMRAAIEMIKKIRNQK